MLFVAVTSGLLLFFLFVAMFGKIGLQADRKRRRLTSIVSRPRNVYEEELNDPFVKRFVVPTFYNIIQSFSRVLGRKSEETPSKIEKNLALAGLRMSASEYRAIFYVYVIGMIIITIVLTALLSNSFFLQALIFIGGIFLAMSGMHFFMTAKINIRQEKIREQMPDILDLLTVSVEAGLSFDGALIYIEQYAGGPMVEELSIAKKEIQMGLPRRDALKRLAERNNVEELKSFIGALVQSDQIGIPIHNVLRIQAAALRLFRKQQAEEKAMKAPVKMMLPLVLFIFPVTIIILLGPTVLNLIKTFS
jgi:tight adherence protein C